jgi:hypothetical protein
MDMPMISPNVSEQWIQVLAFDEAHPRLGIQPLHDIAVVEPFLALVKGFGDITLRTSGDIYHRNTPSTSRQYFPFTSADSNILSSCGKGLFVLAITSLRASSRYISMERV